MEFTLPYYSYCENAVGMLTQPFNTFTCLAYWVVAFLMLVNRDEGGRDSEFHTVTAFFLFLHGACGMFWHIADRPWGLTFDIISALLLVAMLATVLCNKLLGWKPLFCLIAVVVMFLASFALKDTGIPFLRQNGGAFLPPLFMLAFVALLVQVRNQNATLYLLCAAYTLFFGVVLRSIDIVSCLKFPMGTHSLSHVMAAISVAYVVKAIDTHDIIDSEEIRKEKKKVVAERKDPLEIS